MSNPGLTNAQQGGIPITPEAAWTTLMNAQVFNNVTTNANSTAHDVSDENALWVLIDIDSTLTPTDIRVLPQFSNDAGTTWWDFEEGFWASLFWEDGDTAGGINKAYLLPCGGQDLVRFRVVAQGTTAANLFTVSIIVRAFFGSFGVAHA